MYLIRNVEIHKIDFDSLISSDMSSILQIQKGNFDSVPVVSTFAEMRRNTGRAYGGRARWIFCKKMLTSKLPVVSAIVAMPALPSEPSVTYGENDCQIVSNGTRNVY